MGLLSTILSAIPSPELNIEIVVGDKTTDNSETTVIVDQGDGAFAREEDGREIIDVANLNDQQREKAQKALREEWESFDELFREGASREKEQLSANLDDEQIAETLQYFRPLIPENYVRILEAALHFRKQESMMNPPPKGWVRERRRDIADKYDGHVYHVINLCSAGYFDEGGYLRKLHNEMTAQESYKEGDYAEAFEQIVANRPLTLFVSGTDTVSEIKQSLYSKIQDRAEYHVDVEFIEVRGIGVGNRRRIKNALEIMMEEVEEFEVNVINESPELVMRIDPDTVRLPGPN